MRNLSRLLLLAAFVLAGPATAHEPGVAMLRIDAAAATLRAELDLADLDYVLGLDADGDGTISASDLGARRASVEAYVADRLQLDGCTPDRSKARTGLRRATPPAVIVDLPLVCARHPESAASTLFDTLPDYRVLLEADDRRQFVLSALPVTLDARAGAALHSFFIEGVHHILIGLDHLAFLLVLVLPLAVTGMWRRRLRDTAGIVTAFTIAHSITLTLSALGHISLPGKPVEITIALSVVLAALLNLRSRRPLPNWSLAYGFGLVHGFGFAGALGDLAIADGLTTASLLAFNLGVEAGQLLVIAVALPLLHLLENVPVLRGRLVPAGSTLVAVLGLVWVVERL